MPVSDIKTPGVYINEINAFPNTVVAVATAVPAFIGYTPQATFQGRSYTGIPTKISSFADFKKIFCFPDPPAPQTPAKQYSPQYYLAPQKSQPTNGNYLLINNTWYSIVPDPNTIYYFYDSIKLFYENGGGDAYIVSVGGYGSPAKVAVDANQPLINPNVSLNDLTSGLNALLNESEPTMYICPEATLLSVSDNATLMQAMLLQSSNVQTAISVFDIIGAKNPDPLMFMNDIATFRNNTGNTGLDFGTAYYPFIATDMTSQQDIDYTNLLGGDVKQLQQIIDPNHQDSVLATIFNNAASPNFAVQQIHDALLNASKDYQSIINAVLADVNLLPPSAALAGVMTATDSNQGVWEPPANKSIVGAVSLPICLNDNQQDLLNVDVGTGKSVNAIRFFNGIGMLIWGARTLDGNSQDWRYLNVRRTMIMLEQSCKLAARAYVFQPNDKNTWEAVKSMINSFLTSMWKEGGLLGANAADAFSVDCGLGTTMTSGDILNGYMNVTVKVAVVRPAEFIIFTFQQQMATSS